MKIVVCNNLENYIKKLLISAENTFDNSRILFLRKKVYILNELFGVDVNKFWWVNLFIKAKIALFTLKRASSIETSVFRKSFNWNCTKTCLGFREIMADRKTLQLPAKLMKRNLWFSREFRKKPLRLNTTSRGTDLILASFARRLHPDLDDVCGLGRQDGQGPSRHA